MRRLSICLIGIIATGLTLFAQKTYQTDVYSNLIYSLQVKPDGETMAPPIITLDSDEQIVINFDHIGHDYNRFAYNIIHCDANWQQSSLLPIEYLDGFLGLTIEDFANSMTTTTQYTNYLLYLPNEDIRLKASGNYAVQVYPENEPDKILFTACFSVVEPLVSVNAAITGNTMTDFNNEHQQVNFTINYKNVPITYPQSDLKLYVYQNNRRDNAVTNLKPTTILKDQLVYDNNRDLIFPAGNEYRRMEFLSNRYNGMGVNSIQFFNPYYNVELRTDRLRSRSSYTYDQDQNGRYFVGCSSCSDADTEADYYIVHFALESNPLADGKVYLQGDLTNNVLDGKSEMTYNPETNLYEKSILLKQGSYNYQYLYVQNGTSIGQTRITEGNYYQTENEYTIYIYYRPMGIRYDRLIGTATVKNTMRVL